MNENELENNKYRKLSTKWIERHKKLQNRLFDKHRDAIDLVSKKLLAGSVSGLMLLTAPAPLAISAPLDLISIEQVTKQFAKNTSIVSQLGSILSDNATSLDFLQEQEASKVLSNYYGFKVLSELNGIRLNTTYGLIGGEQHLYRYPGDTLISHADNKTDTIMYIGSGIAPGLGAWGYFAPSKNQFTEEDEVREKYYIAAQTFLAPGFNQNVVKYRDFFKFRKMLVVNPNTGQSVVAVIGDAGPALWTGKNFGGSPEVMHFLGYGKGPRKGPVLCFFIDDPENKVPLGPVKDIIKIQIT